MDLNEEATQVSNVASGINGKIDVFTNEAGNHFDRDNWYKQLFELNDVEDDTIEDQYKVLYSVVEDTGGGTLVEFGKLASNLYFGLNEETLALYDEDYYKAYQQSDEIDIFEWSSNHLINVYNTDDMEYQLVANQTKEFKPHIDKDNIIEESLYELVKYLNLNTNLDWDYNEIYDNCAISEDDEDYTEIFVNLDDNNEVYYTINKNDNSDNKKYTNLEDVVKAL